MTVKKVSSYSLFPSHLHSPNSTLDVAATGFLATTNLIPIPTSLMALVLDAAPPTCLTHLSAYSRLFALLLYSFCTAQESS